MALDDLWRQVAESPDDLGARMVLADALVEAGDNRGELIHLQCAGDSMSDVRANVVEQASELVAANWERWLGDLALVIARQGSTFHEGMLHTVHVGMPETPAWAWDKIGGHRELCVVRRVRTKVVTGHYVTFLAGLRRDPEWIDLPDSRLIEQLAALRARWPCRGIRCHFNLVAPDVVRLAALFGDLEEVVLSSDPAPHPEQSFHDAIRRLPTLLPRLRSIKIERWEYLEHLDQAALERLRALPLVELR